MTHDKQNMISINFLMMKPHFVVQYYTDIIRLDEAIVKRKVKNNLQITGYILN
jgi:hypothetical protein